MKFKAIFFNRCGAFLPVSYMRAKKFRPKGEARRPKVGWWGEAPSRAPPLLSGSHNHKAKALLSGLKHKTSKFDKRNQRNEKRAIRTHLPALAREKRKQVRALRFGC